MTFLKLGYYMGTVLLVFGFAGLFGLVFQSLRSSLQSRSFYRKKMQERRLRRQKLEDQEDYEA